MHPVFLAVAIYAVAVLLGVAALVLRQRAVPRWSMLRWTEPHRRAPRSTVELRPWMDLDGSARRQRHRVVSMR